MSHTGYSTNGYGTPVSLHQCDTCGDRYTVCPAVDADSGLSRNCLGIACSSYDPDCDVDRMLEEGSVTLHRGGKRCSA